MCDLIKLISFFISNVLSNIDLAYFSSVGLAGFTVLATLIYHFPPTGGEYYAFMKNLTATGSLMLLSTLFLN